MIAEPSIIYPRSVPPMHRLLRILPLGFAFLLFALPSFQRANAWTPAGEPVPDITPLRKVTELSGWRVKARDSEDWKPIRTDDSWETVLGVQ
ncbi:MAG: hypothetical protein MUD03_17195, partial [Pirellula sp.]|nr:hypothetical protein [Pirellula sp.]